MLHDGTAVAIAASPIDVKKKEVLFVLHAYVTSAFIYVYDVNFDVRFLYGILTICYAWLSHIFSARFFFYYQLNILGSDFLKLGQLMFMQKLHKKTNFLRLILAITDNISLFIKASHFHKSQQTFLGLIYKSKKQFLKAQIVVNAVSNWKFFLLFKNVAKHFFFAIS